MLNIFKKKTNSDSNIKEISNAKVTLLSSISAIVAGLLVGLLFLFIIEAVKEVSDMTNPFWGFSNLLTAGFTSMTRITKVFYNTAPLLMCGLSVGFAFKAGLFNIGATGQYTVGGFFALIAAIIWNFPWWAAILVAMIAGAVWGLIPGLFKAVFNINEVITTIMLNWAGLFFVNLLFYNVHKNVYDSQGNLIETIWMYTSPERTTNLLSANPNAILPNLGLQNLLDSSYINIGIFIAILFAVIMYIVLDKTTFGFEIKACGHNKNASTYAGIKAKQTIIMTMLIAGGLAGVGGGIMFLSGTVDYTVSNTTLLAMGFNGIPVALLAFSNPLGIIASSLFISYLQVGGEAMQPIFSVEMVNVITSVIIYFSAFSLILSQYIKKRVNKSKESTKIDLDNEEDSDKKEEAPKTQDKTKDGKKEATK